ncbi:hypothetical protein QN277_010802 [Acacia crassicarpa]|uniref:Protein kinase domain-containing protein n=1 Tax=Acacia crassicarpa TaxID=499986 RepID=A0AAE1M653_9FABA|nr:hypothetical protein QN277_010802 [Acacia crassicarpa]
MAAEGLEGGRIVVIVGASKDVSSKPIMKALEKACPKAGYEVILIAVLEQLISPMGIKIRVPDANQKIVDSELAKIRDDCNKSSEILKLSQYCGTKKMDFQIDVVAYPFIEVASDAATSLGATWLIIDRFLTRDKKKSRLPCGIIRIRSDSTVQKLWGTDDSKSHSAMKIILENPVPDEEISPKRHRTSPSEQQHLTSMNDKEQGGGDQQEFTTSDHEESQMETEFTNPLCSVCKNKRPKAGLFRDLSYTELWKATQGFSHKNFLSEGGFGAVYKAELSGITIAVKKLKNTSVQGEKEFKSEVKLLSRARHENVVVLLGSCSEGKHRLLVYEYVCNGSLDQHLSQHSRSPLTWEERIKVAIGVSKGLQYLHENNIVHRDVRPNNILLTHDRQTLLGDFGLARNQHQDSIQSTEVIGTYGYLAPEYAEYGKVSAKIDAYSFGVVLLELITGMRTTDKRLKGRSLVGWARPLLKQRKYHDLIDERISNCHDFYQLFWMVRIAEKCLTRDPQKRLNMVAVVNALSHIMEGNTCIILKDYSWPVRSSDSDESESEGELEEEEAFGELESESTDSSSSSISCSNTMSQIIGSLPPSPPILTNS